MDLPAIPPPPSAPISTKELNQSRVKMGLIGLLCAGDESAFSPFHTAIVRALGGGDVHLGFIGAVMQSIAQLFSWLGAIALRLLKYNRQAMVASLLIGAFIQGLIVILLVTASVNSAWAAFFLYGYLAMITAMSMMTGVQQTIIASWIGDMVPTHHRGRFVSVMAITSNVGLVLLQIFFAKIATITDGLAGYSALMGLVCINTLVAVALCYRIPNRLSLAVKFVSKKPEDHVNYRYGPMWLLIWFECAWRVGRVAMGAFTTAYLLDYFGMTMSRIILLQMIVNVVNIFMLYIVGRISDRLGNRLPLAVVSAIAGSSMLLWVASAWWGVWPIFAYMVINGIAGSTHWMLLTNLSLEVYPAKGRPNFLSFSKTLVGVVLMAGGTFAGYLMSQMRGWSMVLWGAEIDHYHVFFLACTVLTLGCLVPLWFLGKMKMPVHDEPVTEGTVKPCIAIDRQDKE